MPPTSTSRAELLAYDALDNVAGVEEATTGRLQLAEEPVGAVPW